MSDERPMLSVESVDVARTILERCSFTITHPDDEEEPATV